MPSTAVLPDVVTLADPHSPAAEAFRTLRTNIQFSSLDKPMRRLLLTSAGADDGKSLTVANLAVAMAQAELRGSARMESILEELVRRADIVLLDSPPVVAVTDAAVLSAKMDGCLLVV